MDVNFDAESLFFFVTFRQPGYVAESITFSNDVKGDTKVKSRNVYHIEKTKIRKNTQHIEFLCENKLKIVLNILTSANRLELVYQNIVHVYSFRKIALYKNSKTTLFAFSCENLQEQK